LNLVHGRGWARAVICCLALALASSTAAQPPALVLMGAGDIADCRSDRAEATARLLDKIAGTVFTAGDNAYGSGSAKEFAECYHPTWGRHRDRTRPSVGNHDYETDHAAPYFKYFGANAGPANRGYYSYKLGAWHILSLNSNTNGRFWGAAQEQWLIQELAATKSDCRLAYWHHPLFSSSTTHGNQLHVRRLFKILQTHGTDIVIAGHDHVYERFALQDAEGRADPHGIRQFIVGTGGEKLYQFGPARPNSEVRNGTDHGVLKLTLHSQGYDWEFVPVAGGKFHDRGSGKCSAPLATMRR
jgi:calcineurin-like phosphoesterase family protein